MAEKVRQDMRTTIVSIVEAIKKIIPSSTEELLSAALVALKTVASTMSAGEEYVLTTTVPLVVQAVQHRQATSSALGALLTLSCVRFCSYIHLESNDMLFLANNSGLG